MKNKVQNSYAFDAVMQNTTQVSIGYIDLMFMLAMLDIVQYISLLATVFKIQDYDVTFST